MLKLWVEKIQISLDTLTKNLLFKGFTELKKHVGTILVLIKYMLKETDLQCL